MFEPTSRYHGLETATRATAGGRTVAYARRRFLPQGREIPAIEAAEVRQGDRLDRIAAARLGDPETFWRIADANDAMHPGDLTEELGRRLRIPVLQGLELGR